MAWSPDGGTLALLTAGELYLYDRTTAASRLLAANPKWQTWRFAWTPRGDALVVDGDVVDIETGRIQPSVEPQFKVVASELSPDQRLLAVLDNPRIIQPRSDTVSRCCQPALKLSEGQPHPCP